VKSYDYKHIIPQDNGTFTVKGYDHWPAHSVLAGQVRINFIASYRTLTGAREDHPDAELSHPFIEPVNTFNHLSGEGDL